MVFFSAAKSNCEVYAAGGVLKKPTLLVRRHPNKEVYLEHIQDFFVVVRTSQSHSFEVFLVNENDAFGFLSRQEEESKQGKQAKQEESKQELEDPAPKKGLIDYCFEAKKVVPLTPSPSPKSEVIEDTYRIFDMDVLKVALFYSDDD